jgi:hypothetical protein
MSMSWPPLMAADVQGFAMPAPHLASVRTRLENLIALAGLLERIESHPMGVGAEQYRGLVLQLRELLGEELPEHALRQVLDAHPATAELYENMRYEHLGLSRSSLESAVATEMQASALLQRIGREARGGG